MRLIDADAVLKAVNDFPFGYRGMIRNVVYNTPTIDAVEIVRCKECEYWGTLSCRLCWDDIVKPEEDFFCKGGERKS